MRAWRPTAFLILLMACTLSACTPFTPAPSLTVTESAPTVTLPPSAAPTTTPAPTHTAMPTVTLTPTARPATATQQPAHNLCSPLEGIALAELSQPDLLKNPFVPPRPGMDGGHQGVDFAFWSWGERKTMQGLPILSVLNGRVAAALPLRQPYGYAVIIETSLKDLPAAWLADAPIPTPAPTVQPAPNMICPPGGETEGLAIGQFPADYSLYLLYAHLDEPAGVQTGQEVSCGQAIGAAGTTGNSVNVHLHLETRLGPSGASFSSLGYYDTAVTDLERSNYCTWRVSGLFQLFDPLRLLSLQP